MNEIRGYQIHELCMRLAVGKLAKARLAEIYDVSIATITKFEKKYSFRIEDIKEEIAKNLEDDFIGLWVANKVHRVASYQADIEFLEGYLSDDAEVDDAVKVIKTKHGALRSVAEELGQLPTRVQVDLSGQTKVNYCIEGINPKDVM